MAKMAFEFLDVGMGDGTFVIMGDDPENQQLALIDLGVQPYTKFKVGAKDAVDYVVDTIAKISKARDLAYPYLDHLFITHPDQDHYNLIVRLIKEIYPGYGIQNLKIGWLTYGGRATLYGGEIENIAKHVVNKAAIGDLGSLVHAPVNKSTGAVTRNWEYAGGNIKIYVLNVNYPNKESDVPNPLSLCLMFKDDFGNKMIFLGDAEAEVEEQIIKNFKDASASFLNAYGLKLGHHGSKKGTSSKWLKAVKPKAVFASGDMVWAHPYCETITRVIDAKTLDSTRDHWWCCGKYIKDDDEGSGNEYFNTPSKLAVCLNLWYVVKDKAGIKMKDINDKVAHAKQGLTYGVQWELEFDGPTEPSFAWTDTSTPVLPKK